jgi:hypothetical protein
MFLIELALIGRKPRPYSACRVPDLTDDPAGQLAERLGDLPLALDQAAAYLGQTGMPPSEYLRLLDTHGADLRTRGQVSGHSGTIATVCPVSLDRLQVTAPAAVQLLELCAWLAPESLFTGHCELLPEPLAAAAQGRPRRITRSGQRLWLRRCSRAGGRCMPLERPLTSAPNMKYVRLYGTQVPLK